MLLRSLGPPPRTGNLPQRAGLHQLFLNWGHRRKPPTQKPLAVPASVLDHFPARAATADFGEEINSLARSRSQVPARLWTHRAAQELGLALPGPPCVAWWPPQGLTSQPPRCPGRRQSRAHSLPCSPHSAALCCWHPPAQSPGSGRGCRPGPTLSPQGESGIRLLSGGEAPLRLHPRPLPATAHGSRGPRPPCSAHVAWVGLSPAPAGLWHVTRPGPSQQRALVQ